MCLFPLICSAQTQKSKSFTCKVKVAVSGSDNIKGEIKSFISRGLRSLGDVIVTDNNPDWLLSIVELETSTKNGYKSEVTLSVVILVPYDNKYILNEVSEESKKYISLSTSDLYSFKEHWLRVCSSEDLRNLCNGIVADFDTEYIKYARNIWQIYLDYQKK